MKCKHQVDHLKVTVNISVDECATAAETAADVPFSFRFQTTFMLSIKFARNLYIKIRNTKINHSL